MTTRKVHPSQGADDQSLAGETLSHAAGGGVSGTNDVVGPPRLQRKTPSMVGSSTTEIANDMKATVARNSVETDTEVFQRLRENAEKRYGGGDTPMAWTN